MKKSIKTAVLIRVAAAYAATILFSFTNTFNLLNVQRILRYDENLTQLENNIQAAEIAHYKWASNLSSAIYSGTEFTGSTDHTACILGQWIYGEAETDDVQILNLRAQIEPLHMALHQSALTVLETLNNNSESARQYYQTTIQSNLDSVVAMMDQITEISDSLRAAKEVELNNAVMMMHLGTVIGLALSLACLGSLVFYMLRRIVKPIIKIIECSEPLHDGALNIKIDCGVKNEIGDLAYTLQSSLGGIYNYVIDINRIMLQLSDGNFNVTTYTNYIGDFHTIQESMKSFTTTISDVLKDIEQAQLRISGHAGQLSENSQTVAQGATEQASSVQELYATLDTLSKSAEQNVIVAAKAKQHAILTQKQIDICSEQSKDMVAAMGNISDTSEKIGQIISTIESIAFQTNILALNAAVEAARAGEAGKGFAVVAEEVRTLATQTDEAAKATNELIEDCVAASQKGIQIVNSVSDSLQKTMEYVTQSNKDIGIITDVVDDEAESIKQVTIGIEQIATVTQTNSASSEEAAAVSSELFAEAKMMQEQLEKFKLKD